MKNMKCASPQYITREKSPLHSSESCYSELLCTIEIISKHPEARTSGWEKNRISCRSVITCDSYGIFHIRSEWPWDSCELTFHRETLTCRTDEYCIFESFEALLESIKCISFIRSSRDKESMWVIKCCKCSFKTLTWCWLRVIDIGDPISYPDSLYTMRKTCYIVEIEIRTFGTYFQSTSEESYSENIECIVHPGKMRFRQSIFFSSGYHYFFSIRIIFLWSNRYFLS